MITQEKRAEWDRLTNLWERTEPCPGCGNNPPHRILPDGEGLALRCRSCDIDIELAWMHQRMDEERETAQAILFSAAEFEKGSSARTQALDFVTIAHCFRTLDDHFRSELQWESVNDKQKQFFGWLTGNADKLKYLCGLQGLASLRHEELNAFLVEHGFKPKFKPFEDGIGVASILDMLVNWIETAIDYPVRRGEQEYPGFRIHADVFITPWSDRPLVQLTTKTGHSVWLIMAPEPANESDLALSAQEIAGTSKHSFHHYDGVVIPKLEIDIEPDLDWLKGTRTTIWRKPWQIDQAFQMFKLRLNEKGARVKVATGMVAVAASAGPSSGPLIFDQPFIGYFTHPGLDDLPIAAFYAGIDSWKEPSGSLEEL